MDNELNFDSRPIRKNDNDIKISIALPIRPAMLTTLTPFFNIVNFLKQHFSEKEIQLVLEKSCSDTALLEISDKMRQCMGFPEDIFFRCMGWLKLISLIYWGASSKDVVIMNLSWHGQGYVFEPITMQTVACFLDLISPYVEASYESFGSLNFKNDEGIEKTKSLIFVNEYLDFSFNSPVNSENVF